MPPDVEAALALARVWLEPAPWPKAESGMALLRVFGAPDGVDMLAARLASAGLEDWSAELRAEGAEPIDGAAASPNIRALAWALAVDLVTRCDHPHLFEIVGELLWISGRSPAQLAAEPCLGANGPEPLLLNALRLRLQAIYESRYFERLRTYIANQGHAPLTTRAIWPGHGDMPIGDTWVHLVAARCWPAAYLQMVATFPAAFQSAVAQVFDAADLDLVRMLIAASPEIFEPNGVPLGPVTVFSLLEDVERRLTKDAVARPDQARDDATLVIEAIAARADSAWLLRAWLQQLIWRGPPRQAGRDDTEMTAYRAFRDWLIAALSATAPALSVGVFEWVRAEEPLWMVYRVLTEASVLQAHGDASAAAAILADAVRQGLITATGRREGLNSHAPEALVVGQVLARLDDPRAWFERLWRDTYDLREHLSFATHRDFDNPAYSVLAWGLTGVNVSGPRPDIDTAAFWRSVAASLFETQLIDVNAELWNGVVPVLCHVAVQLGGTFVEDRILAPDALADFMRDQLDPDPQHAQLWVVLRSVTSDANALTIGRLVGVTALRQALEQALDEDTGRRREAILDGATRASIRDFAARL